jgi:hypothetical protein
MAYIGRDGTIGGQEQKTIRQKIEDFFAGIIGFISLFFSAITNPPSAIEGRNYAQRNNNNPYRGGGNASGGSSSGGRGGANIRGVKNLQGTADAKMGGG